METIFNYKKCEQEDFYNLLGCDENASVEQILTEYKTLCIKYHPDKNPNDPSAACKFQKIQHAKEVLLDSKLRCAYDKWRYSNLSIPFDKFCNAAMHTSLHWACDKKKSLMIEDSSPSCNPVHSCNNKGTSWERDPGNEVLRKFRNYEI